MILVGLVVSIAKVETPEGLESGVISAVFFLVYLDLLAGDFGSLESEAVVVTIFFVRRTGGNKGESVPHKNILMTFMRGAVSKLNLYNKKNNMKF